MTGRTHSRFVGRIVVVSLGVAVIAAVAPRIGGPTDPVDAAPTNVIAQYEMNEVAGSSVLVDSSGNGLNGTIGNDVKILQFDGSTRGHQFALVQPDTTVTYPGHIDIVPENNLLDPGTQDFAVTVRYRKTKSWGNILQKGQNTVPGGYFKIEMPGDTASCLFKDGTGKTGGLTTPATIVKNGVTVPLDMSDGQWHILRCERLKTEVKMYVDGIEVAKTGSAVGNIDNSWPLVFGGKIDCDPPAPGVTCDYYSGDIDYAYFEKGDGVVANLAPHAAFTASPAGSTNTFAFNASTSTDTDGTIASYAWDFGDGTTGTGVTATHSYATTGTYNVDLVVTDDDGAFDDKTQSVKATVPPTTTTSTTTTTTIVAQLPPEGLTEVPEAASGGVPAERLPAFDATDAETTTTLEGG